MSLLNQNPWIIREALPNELNLIYATWLNSFQGDSQIGFSCSKTTFFNEYPGIIDQILARPLTKIIVASFPDSPEVILSYLVFEPKILHYTFTKEIYRKSGIAKSLYHSAFHEEPAQFTHKTSWALPILEKYEKFLSYNPFKLYQKEKI